MIVYSSNKSGFLNDVFSNDIENIVLGNVKRKLNKGVSISEIKSWAHSLQYMDRILREPSIPDDCGIAIEYQILLSGASVPADTAIRLSGI